MPRACCPYAYFLVPPVLLACPACGCPTLGPLAPAPGPPCRPTCSTSSRCSASRCVWALPAAQEHLAKRVPKAMGARGSWGSTPPLTARTRTRRRPPALTHTRTRCETFACWPTWTMARPRCPTTWWLPTGSSTRGWRARFGAARAVPRASALAVRPLRQSTGAAPPASQPTAAATPCRRAHRYMDSKEEEQARGITMKSSSISLLHVPRSATARGDSGPLPAAEVLERGEPGEAGGRVGV